MGLVHVGTNKKMSRPAIGWGQLELTQTASTQPEPKSTNVRTRKRKRRIHDDAFGFADVQLLPRGKKLIPRQAGTKDVSALGDSERGSGRSTPREVDVMDQQPHNNACSNTETVIIEGGFDKPEVTSPVVFRTSAHVADDALTAHEVSSDRFSRTAEGARVAEVQLTSESWETYEVSQTMPVLETQLPRVLLDC